MKGYTHKCSPQIDCAYVYTMAQLYTSCKYTLRTCAKLPHKISSCNFYV